jgi:DNA-binding transcriptional LysR family regulator
MRSLPPLANLRAFEAVARRGSFALAANLAPSAISQPQRAARVSPGPAAVRPRDARGEAERRWAAPPRPCGRHPGRDRRATDDVRQGLRNGLYLHTSSSFASLWLMPRLAAFAQASADISLFLPASPTHSDFALGQADVDIRHGLPHWPDLVVPLLFEKRIVPLASPNCLERHRVREPADLLSAPLIQSTVGGVKWTNWLGRRGIPQGPERFVLRLDCAQLAMDAAVQGLGTALKSATIAGRSLDDGRAGSGVRPRLGLPVQARFLVYPARHGKRPEVKVFTRWLQAAARRDCAR